MEMPDTTTDQVVNVVLTGADLVRGAEAKREKVKETLLNIIEGHIQNPNTRSGYRTAWHGFFKFCSEYRLELEKMQPFHIRMYLKGYPGGVATQRQHLSAIRLLFNELVEQGVVALNPAAEPSRRRFNARVHTRQYLKRTKSRFSWEQLNSNALETFVTRLFSAS